MNKNAIKFHCSDKEYLKLLKTFTDTVTSSIYLVTSNIYCCIQQRAQNFPIVSSYVSTVHKVMGKTLEHVTLVFDMQILSPAIG